MGQIKYQMEGKMNCNKTFLTLLKSFIDPLSEYTSCLEVESDMKGFVLVKHKNPIGIVQRVYLQEC